MKWIIVVYLTTFNPVEPLLENRKMAFEIKSQSHCQLMQRHINYIGSYGSFSQFAFVRSLYQMSNADMMYAKCVKKKT